LCVFYRSFILCWDALAHGGMKCFWLCLCMVYFTGLSFLWGCIGAWGYEMFLAVSLYGVFYRSFIFCWDALAHGGIKCFWLCLCMVYFTGLSFFVGMHWRMVVSNVFGCVIVWCILQVFRSLLGCIGVRWHQKF